MLWGHALEELADALQDKVFGPSNQADFDTVATDNGMTQAGPGERFNVREAAPRTEDLPELADILPGHRNVALFHHLRYYAYRQVAHHDEFAAFSTEVADFANGCRSQLLDVEGFPESEAEGIAKSVATWTWAVVAQGSEGAEKRREPHNGTRPPASPGRRRLPRRSGSER